MKLKVSLILFFAKIVFFKVMSERARQNEKMENNGVRFFHGSRGCVVCSLVYFICACKKKASRES